MKTTTRLGIILAISTAFFAVEIAIGFRTKSLVRIYMIDPTCIANELPV